MKMFRQSGSCSASARSWNTVSIPSVAGRCTREVGTTFLA